MVGSVANPSPPSGIGTTGYHRGATEPHLRRLGHIFDGIFQRGRHAGQPVLRHSEAIPQTKTTPDRLFEKHLTDKFCAGSKLLRAKRFAERKVLRHFAILSPLRPQLKNCSVLGALQLAERFEHIAIFELLRTQKF